MNTVITTPPHIAFEEVEFAYDGQPVLRRLSFAFRPGEFLSVIGPNGAGKTTLLRLLSGMLTPSSGRISAAGRGMEHFSARERARHIAVVPQMEAVVFPWSVTAMVLLGRHPHTAGFGYESARDREAAHEAMALVGVAHLAARSVTDLSGGELHRVLIARALAQETPVLLLDEPNAHLDIRHQVDLFGLLSRLHRDQGRSILIITHDLNLASMYSDRIMLLDAGASVALGTPAEVLRPDILSRHFQVDVRVETDESTGRPHVIVKPQGN